MHQVFRMLARIRRFRRFPPQLLQREDILACFDYAAALVEEEVSPLENLTAFSYFTSAR